MSTRNDIATPLKAAGPVAEQFETMAQQREADLLGMWAFLVTEIMMFGSVFMAFVVYRSLYPEAFQVAAGHLHWVIGTSNTAILLTSSLTMGLAEWHTNQGRSKAALLFLAGTIMLGLAFLALKGYEYNLEFHEGLAPFTGFNFTYDGPQIPHANLFFRFYYTMTALHALHMSIGIGILAVMAVNVYRWREPGRIARQVQIAGIYWAFVDIVWIFVYPTLYMTGHALP